MASESIVIDITGRLEGANRIKRSLDEIGTAGDKTTASVQRFDTQTQKTSRSVKALNGVLLSAKGAFTGFIAAIGIRAVDNFTMLNSRIKNATKSTEEFNKVYSGLNAIVSETGSKMNDLVDVFQRLSFVREEIGATADEMLIFTETVSKLGIISGASTQALSAGLTQLGQGLGAGVLRAEEFNSIVENIPSVANAIAKEFGVTTGELRRLVLAGEVLSQDVFNAILNQAERTREEFEAMPRTIGQAGSAFVNEFGQALGILFQTSDTQSTIVKLIDMGTNALSGFKDVLVTLEPVLNVIGDIFNGIIKAITIAKRMIIGLVESVKVLTDGVIELINKIPGIDIQARAGGDINKVNEGSEAFASIFNGADLSTKSETKSSVSIEIKELTKDYKGLAVAIGNGKKETAKLSEETLELIKNQKEFKETITDAFSSFVTGAKNAKEALSDLIGSFASKLASRGSDMLFEGLFGKTDGKGGGFSGGILSSALGGIGSLFGFSNGGEFTVGNSMQRVDAGADNRLVQFAARDGEKVKVMKPNEKESGGSTIVYNIDARGAEQGVEQRIMAVLNKVSQSIEPRSVSAVKSEIKRNPSYLGV